jgi:hypothetical protein
MNACTHPQAPQEDQVPIAIDIEIEIEIDIDIDLQEGIDDGRMRAFHTEVLNQGPKTLTGTGCAQLFEGDGEHDFSIQVAATDPPC